MVNTGQKQTLVILVYVVRCVKAPRRNVATLGAFVTREVEYARLPGKKIKLPKREAGPPSHHDKTVDSDQ